MAIYWGASKSARGGSAIAGATIILTRQAALSGTTERLRLSLPRAECRQPARHIEEARQPDMASRDHHGSPHERDDALTACGVGSIGFAQRRQECGLLDLNAVQE